ncbi:MAG: UDP-glucose/GDP-mannose dehydrogenase family protein [Chloroflexi bacterium]|nr:UDP-glucose/GDP-mannose dehydrogenase family protein [Chloroflexota bacterium]
MRRLCVIGAGYVGLVTGACFADLGNWVTCIDIDKAKVKSLSKGVIPFYEPGLAELVKRNLRSQRLSFTNLYSEGVPDADFVFIGVNTPSGTEGEADMTDMSAAVESIADCLTKYAIIVNKSTVPIGTGDWVANQVQRKNDKAAFDVVSNPEFLREGRAVTDFMNPDRIVLGCTKRAAAEQVAALYATFQCPIIITDLRTAEMIKYASNAFLATRISFINEMAAICDELGADVEEVARGMGLDKRIGRAFLDAGIGYGGSCFPKDVSALAHMASIHGCHPQLLRAVMEINRDQRHVVVQRLRGVLGSLDGLTIGILGLSFKPDTDDMRNAPSVEIIHLLKNEGAQVKAYDPAAMERARKLIKGIQLCPDAYAVAEGSDALVVATEWNEFKQLDMARVKSLMRQPILIDGRNIYDPAEMRGMGFVYYGVGRGIPRILNGQAR